MQRNERALHETIFVGFRSHQRSSLLLFIMIIKKKAVSANKMFLLRAFLVLTEMGCLAFCIDLNGSICVNIYLVKYIELYRI